MKFFCEKNLKAFITKTSWTIAHKYWQNLFIPTLVLTQTLKGPCFHQGPTNAINKVVTDVHEIFLKRN